MHSRRPFFSVHRRCRAVCLVVVVVLGFGLLEAPRASAQLSERFAAFLSPPLRALREELHQNEGELAALPLPPGNESTARIGWHSVFWPPTGVVARFLQVDLGAVEPFDAIVLVPVSLSEAGQERPGYGFPVRFRVESSETPEFAKPAILADYTESDFTNPGQLPVVVEANEGRGRFIRVTATRLYSRGDRSLFALGELMVGTVESHGWAQRIGVPGDCCAFSGERLPFGDRGE
ncbi:MAG: discoidin domain-containing protein [Verrucomicrobia bacterium]|nr:discoidin domain-containing protein [Verrucomicrobiota bacterium]